MNKQVVDKNGNIIHGLQKDPNGTIVNCDTEAYKKYLKEKERLSNISNLQTEVEDLKSDISIIKDSLSEILNRLKNG